MSHTTTRNRPITVTLNATNQINALIEIYDYLIDHPKVKLESLHVVRFSLNGERRWRVRFRAADDNRPGEKS